MTAFVRGGLATLGLGLTGTVVFVTGTREDFLLFLPFFTTVVQVPPSSSLLSTTIDCCVVEVLTSGSNSEFDTDALSLTSGLTIVLLRLGLRLISVSDPITDVVEGATAFGRFSSGGLLESAASGGRIFFAGKRRSSMPAKRASIIVPTEQTIDRLNFSSTSSLMPRGGGTF